MTRELSAAKARDLVRTAALAEVLEAALDRLVELGEPGLRELILDRYGDLAEHPKRDGGAALRVTLLHALLPLAQLADVAVFEAAARVIEIGWGADTAQNLRAVALTGLAALDETRAAWYATFLLAERQHVSPVTGQPALAAVRLLVALGRPDAVYREALAGGGHPEVQAECFRQLVEMPARLAVELGERVLKGADEPAILGFIDLALARSEIASLLPVLRAFLTSTDRLDVYRYLVTAAAASRREEAIALLVELRPLTTDAHKVAFLDGALELLAPSRP